MPEYYQQPPGEILPNGAYEFRVKNAVLERSLKGNDKINLTLEIKGGGIVFDSLVFVEKAYWKITQFRLATGEKIPTSAKVLFEAKDCLGRKGTCELCTDQYQGKCRNKVAHYLMPDVSWPVSGAAPVPARAAGKNELGEPDDIPF